MSTERPYETAGAGALLFAPALHRRRDAHRLAVFRDRAPRDVDAGLAQDLDDRVVGQHVAARVSASISCLMRWRTASAECASPPSEAAIEEVKKYFSSKMPRLVAMYLLAVTRETVDSCMLIASATVFRLSGRRCCTPWAKKASCWRTISVDTFRIVLAR